MDTAKNHLSHDEIETRHRALFQEQVQLNGQYSGKKMRMFSGDHEAAQKLYHVVGFNIVAYGHDGASMEVANNLHEVINRTGVNDLALVAMYADEQGNHDSRHISDFRAANGL